MKRYLLVAYYDGDKTPLWNQLRAMGPDAKFHLIVPATPPPNNTWTWSEQEAYQVAKQRLDTTLGELKRAGLQADGEVLSFTEQGAIEEALRKDSLRQDSYDELILSTPPQDKARSTLAEYEKRIRIYSQIPIRHLVNENAQEIERA